MCVGGVGQWGSFLAEMLRGRQVNLEARVIEEAECGLGLATSVRSVKLPAFRSVHGTAIVWATCHRHSWLEASLTDEARNARSVAGGCRRECGAQEGAWGSWA